MGADAQHNLGVMHMLGDGTSKDFAEGIKWLRKAADQGHGGAQANLGIALFNGDGVPKDEIEAYAWLNIAAINEPQAGKFRDHIDRRLSADARVLAQQRTKQLLQEIEGRQFERIKKEERKRREDMKKMA